MQVRISLILSQKMLETVAQKSYKAEGVVEVERLSPSPDKNVASFVFPASIRIFGKLKLNSDAGEKSENLICPPSTSMSKL